MRCGTHLYLMSATSRSSKLVSNKNAQWNLLSRINKLYIDIDIDIDIHIDIDRYQWNKNHMINSHFRILA